VAPAACFSIRVSTSTKVCTAFMAEDARPFGSWRPWQLEVMLKSYLLTRSEFLVRADRVRLKNDGGYRKR